MTSWYGTLNSELLQEIYKKNHSNSKHEAILSEVKISSTTDAKVKKLQIFNCRKIKINFDKARRINGNHGQS